jgi:hypothetical protein
MVDINEENKYFRLAKLLLVHQTAIPNDTEKIDFIYSIFSKMSFFLLQIFEKKLHVQNINVADSG